MEVGLTYDLRDEYPLDHQAPPDSHGEFDSVETINHLTTALEGLGHRVRKIGNIHALAKFLTQGERVDIVFNIAEGVRGQSREAQVPALLEAYDIPYTGSDPLTLALCLNKALTKQVWRYHGLPTGADCVIHSLDDLARRQDDLPDFPLFVKPLHEGSSKGISSPDSIIRDAVTLRARVDQLLTWYQQPVLAEAYLPGREFTVAILGNGPEAAVIGVAEVVSISPGGISSFHDKEDWETRAPDYYRPLPAGDLATRLAALALAAYHAVTCRDLGRVDIRLDADEAPQLMEINPLPALNRQHSALTFIGRQAGVGYETLIDRVLTCATSRLNLSS